MSSSPIQPDPKEAVEAQLCAYLEGDLSPGERAAIEEHLAGNPPHRQLLADLARARQWLRDLPPQPAPPEVGEAFQQQVERSLLLGEDDASRVRRPGGRLPQIALMAALILVTAGLGVGLMLMLSGPDRPPARYAADVPTSRPAGLPADKPAAAARDAPTMVSAAVVAAPAAAEPARPPVPAAPAGAGGGGGRALSSTLNATVAVPSAPSLYMRVVTADPTAVHGVLARNGLTWEGTGGDVVASGEARRDALSTPEDTAQQYAAGNVQQGQERRRVQGKAQSNSVAPNPPLLTGPRRYVSGGLTAEQAKQLATELRAAAGPGRVSVTGAGPATGPDGSPIVPGEVVTVVIPQLTGPGVSQANTVRVAADGTIALPMIDAVPAAGATREALARRVADRYRQASLIPHPTVTVVTTVTPATRPTSDLQRVTVDVATTPKN